MVTRYIDALDAANAVIATHTETNDAIMSWDIPTIFPSLTPGTTYNFVMRTGETAGYTVPVNTMLDLITPTAVRAFGLRKLRAAYAGSAIRVRRSSDNAETDIGFNADGSLNTTALLAHCGVGNGFITTWYDQSTSGVNLTQTTTSRQPRIVNAGVLEVINSKPAAFFDGSDDVMSQNTAPGLPTADTMTISMVHNLVPDAGFETFLAERSSTVGAPSFELRNSGTGDFDGLVVYLRNDANTVLQNLPKLGDNAVAGGPRQLTVRNQGGAFRSFSAGVQGTGTPTYTPTGTYTTDRFAVGGTVSASGTFTGPPGHIAEVVVYTSALSNADMNVINAEQGEEYGITVTPFLTPVEQLAVINGVGDNGNSLAVNLGGYADWEEPIFIDVAKQARGWQVPGENQNTERALASLPSGDTTATYFFSSFRDGNGSYVGTPPDLSGRYRAILTQGTASAMTGLGITNITQISSTEWEFDCDYVGNKTLTFTPTSFPVKVAIVRTSDIAAYNAGGIWRQEFLDFLPSGGCLRFMDWNGVNNNVTTTEFSQMPTTSWQRWTPMPYSNIVDLCTRKNADAWLCVHAAASDTYVTEMATFLRDNFPTNRRIRVELGNEIWNTGTFPVVGTYFKGLAEAEWGVADGYANGVWLDRAGKRFVQVMNIFNTVFAGQTHRIIGVIGGQAGNVGLASRSLLAPQWQASEPGSYVAPHTLAKEWSIAPYINWTGSAVTRGDEIKAQLDISQAAAVAYIKGMIPASLTQAYGWIDAHVAVAAARGLRLTTYEYNNHYDINHLSASTLYSGGAPVPGALEAFMEATYSQEMADAQDALRDYWKAQNGSLMAFFVSTNRASRFGTWGAKTHIEHNSPIWNDLVAWHAANPRWWAQ